MHIITIYLPTKDWRHFVKRFPTDTWKNDLYPKLQKSPKRLKPLKSQNEENTDKHKIKKEKKKKKQSKAKQANQNPFLSHSLSHANPTTHKLPLSLSQQWYLSPSIATFRHSHSHFSLSPLYINLGFSFCSRYESTRGRSRPRGPVDRASQDRTGGSWRRVRWQRQGEGKTPRRSNGGRLGESRHRVLYPPQAASLQFAIQDECPRALSQF